MDTHHLDQADFLEKLSQLFYCRRSSDHGAIYLVQKSLTYNGMSTSTTGRASTASNPAKSMPVLIRASDGKARNKTFKKIKLSTIVQPENLDKFYLRYAEVCKAGMTALKPRDRSKKRAKAKKKKSCRD